jgi:hypothetical protein
MEFFQRVLLYLALGTLLCLIIGLFEPWIMLWWEDTQNRKKVIKLYGTVTAICFTLYWLLLLI